MKLELFLTANDVERWPQLYAFFEYPPPVAIDPNSVAVLISAIDPRRVDGAQQRISIPLKSWPQFVRMINEFSLNVKPK